MKDANLLGKMANIHAFRLGWEPKNLLISIVENGICCLSISRIENLNLQLFLSIIEGVMNPRTFIYFIR